MNTIEQLEERIAQLTELVKTGSEAIKNMETALKAAEEERDRLADQRREQEPKFERVGKYEKYYSILFDGAAMTCQERDNGQNSFDDTNNFESNNYFKTVQRAENVADKINFLLKLERLHDTFCPDYAPDWNDNEYKYFVFYENRSKRYVVDVSSVREHKPDAFFATAEIAQKVCDILNKELEEKI